MKQHGKIGAGENAHCRWCDVCNQYHGILYRCKHYGDAILAEIDADIKSMDDEWWQKQTDKLPAEVIEITKILCSK